MADMVVTIKLKVELPGHHILTTEQPSKLTWELLEAQGDHVLNQGALEFRVLDPAITIRVPSAQARARIKLWIYFCDAADVACILERRTVDVVNLNPTTTESTLTIPVKITKPAQV
ncbi:MAG: hypothetical protein ACYC6L_06305 [Anaerolineae bacterium]